MGISKVILNGVVKVDLTQDTVDETNLLAGETATGADGEAVEGAIASKASADLTVSGATVTAPAGFYSAAASKSVATTTHPNPTASINSTTGVVTASHTQTTGYVTGGTTTGTLDLTTQAGKTVTPTESEQTAVAAGRYTTGAVKVGAISSTYIGSGIAQNDSDDLTVSGATVNVPAGYYAEAASKSVGTTTHPAPTASINSSTGLVTASHTQGTGYVTGGTTTGTLQITAQAAKTVAPTESEQTAVVAGRYTTGAVKVGAISSTYVGSGITQRDSDDLTASGATVSVPAGYYSAAASKAVASGSAGTPTATKGTVSNHSVSVTPSVTNTTGYITGGTKTGTAVTVSVAELESGTKSITENGTGISVSGYSAVDVDVASQASGTVLWLSVQDNETVSIILSSNSGGIVDWDDGTSESGTWLNDAVSHTYSYGGIKRILLTNVYTINGYALGQTASTSNTSLRMLEIDDGITLGNSAFAYCDNLTMVSLNSWNENVNVTQVFNSDQKLSDIRIQDGVTTIGSTMFYSCSSVEIITLPKTITKIGTNAFGRCSSLSVVHMLPTTPPTLSNAYVFNNNASGRIIYVPYSSDHSILNAYKTATNWSNFASSIQEEPE